MTTSTSATLLKKSWLRLRKKDPRLWSLRQVAREARVSPSYLSKIFSKQKALTLKHAKKLIAVLNVDQIHEETILSSFGTSTRTKGFFNKLPQLDGFELPPDQSEWLLSKWFRLPMLDLMTTDDFQSKPEWISERLGITVREVQDSLEKLVSSGLASINEKGAYKKVNDKIRFPTVISKAMIREYHKSQMRRAISELENKVVPKEFNQRLIVGLSVASNPKKIDEAKSFLHLALYRAAEILSEGQCDEVYQINIQLFPQTKR